MFLSNTTNNQQKYESQRYIDGSSPQFARKHNSREKARNHMFSQSQTPMPRTQVPAPHYLEVQNDFERNKSHSQQQTPSNASRVSSIRSMTNDAQFVEFLKNIILYCTGQEQQDQQIKIGVHQKSQEQSPAVDGVSTSSNNLFKNLNFLKECYQKYKHNKTKQSNLLGKSNNSVKHSPITDTIQSDRLALPRQPSWGTKQRWRVQQQQKQNKDLPVSNTIMQRQQQKKQISKEKYNVTPQMVQSFPYPTSSQINSTPGIIYSPSPFTTQQSQQHKAVQYIVNPYAYPTLGHNNTSSTSSLQSGGQQQIKNQQQILVPQAPIVFVTQQHDLSMSHQAPTTIYPASYVQSPTLNQQQTSNNFMIHPSKSLGSESKSSNGMVAAHKMLICQKTPERKKADRSNLQYIDRVYDVVVNQNRPYFQEGK